MNDTHAHANLPVSLPFNTICLVLPRSLWFKVQTFDAKTFAGAIGFVDDVDGDVRLPDAVRFCHRLSLVTEVFRDQNRKLVRLEIAEFPFPASRGGLEIFGALRLGRISGEKKNQVCEVS